MLTKEKREGYTALLGKWVRFSQKLVSPVPGHRDLCYYGAGSNGHWGIHTNFKAAGAFATASQELSIDWKSLGTSREEVLGQALGMFRYALRTHHSGDINCVDGKSWGYSWIYGMGLERAMHGLDAIEKELVDKDKEMLRRYLLAESEWFLNSYPVEAGLTEGNKPESNIWNGSVLIHTALLYPDAPHADDYMEKGCKFFANGISIPSDKTARSVRDVYVGPNYTEQYGLNHHRYMNIGYMNICLSNVAMLHFFAKHHGFKLPDMVYHHAKDLWQFVRTCTFDDGRLLRIGGDNRARYCYCQDYALPSWALVEDLWNEDCTSMLEGWLKILRTEDKANGDGSFVSGRLGEVWEQSPLYFTRLESDRACSVSTIVYWYRTFNISGMGKPRILAQWQDNFHGGVLATGGNRYASFVWNAKDKPIALCLPKDDSSFAEWSNNMTGIIKGSGTINEEEVVAHTEKEFPGGFITWGHTNCYSEGFMAEGQTREEIARKQIAFAALPDAKTVVSLQYASALNRVYGSIKGINWHVPNDIFNGSIRQIEGGGGSWNLTGGKDGKDELISVGNWINIDNKIGMASSVPLTIVRHAKRNIFIKKQIDTGTLYTEEVCSPYDKSMRWFDRDQILIDAAITVSLGNKDETKKIAETMMVNNKVFPEFVRNICVTTSDGKRYMLILNVSDEFIDLSLQLEGVGKLVPLGLPLENPQEIRLGALEAALFLVVGNHAGSSGLGDRK
jgi:hypothetical protein